MWAFSFLLSHYSDNILITLNILSPFFRNKYSLSTTSCDVANLYPYISNYPLSNAVRISGLSAPSTHPWADSWRVWCSSNWDRSWLAMKSLQKMLGQEQINT